MASFDINPTNHKAVKKQAKINNMQKSTNPNEREVAKKKLTPSGRVGLPNLKQGQQEEIIPGLKLVDIILGEEKCGKGMYYCYTDKKCKKIPEGLKMTARYGGGGREPEEVGIDKPVEGGEGGNGGGDGGGGMGESLSIEDAFGNKFMEVVDLIKPEDISKVYLEQIVKKKDDSYLEPDMKKRQKNNEKARKELAKGPQMKNPHFEEKQQGWDVVNSLSDAFKAMQEEGYKGKHGQSDKQYADSRSDAGKMISGTSKMSGAEFTHGRRVKAANPGMQPDVGGKTKPKSQGTMDAGSREDLMYRKANLKRKHRISKMAKEEEVKVDEKYQGMYQSPSPTNKRVLSGDEKARMSPGRRAMQKSDDLEKTEPGSKRANAQKKHQCRCLVTSNPLKQQQRKKFRLMKQQDFQQSMVTC